MKHPSEYQNIRKGIELGFFNGNPVVYDGTEPVAIDAQAGKGKLTRFLGPNLVSPRTAHLTKIITDPKDAELTWMSWQTLERQGYRVRFINPGGLYGYPSDSYNISSRVIEIAARPELLGILNEAAYDAASYLVPVDPNPSHRWIGQGTRSAFAVYNTITARFPSKRWACTPGGLWDFFARTPDEIADDLLLWASDRRMQDHSGMCRQIAGFTQSTNQWNAYTAKLISDVLAWRRIAQGDESRFRTSRFGRGHLHFWHIGSVRKFESSCDRSLHPLRHLDGS